MYAAHCLLYPPLLFFNFHVLLSSFPCSCRVAVPQQEPLALRQLLWLEDELFVGLSSSLLPTTSTLLMLRPSKDTDGTHTLTVRSATLCVKIMVKYTLNEALKGINYTELYVFLF